MLGLRQGNERHHRGPVGQPGDRARLTDREPSRSTTTAASVDVRLRIATSVGVQEPEIATVVRLCGFIKVQLAIATREL